jgi:hypothetical protein
MRPLSNKVKAGMVECPGKFFIQKILVWQLVEVIPAQCEY